MVHGKTIHCSRSRREASSLQKCMSCLTLSSAQDPKHLIQSVLQQFGNREQKTALKMTISKTEATVPVRHQIEWHVCSGDTSVQILHKLQEFMSEIGRVPESFPDIMIFTSMFNDITDQGGDKVQGKCLHSAKEVATDAATFRLGYRCFCGPGSQQTWKYNESMPTSHFANGRMRQTRYYDDWRSYPQQTSCAQVFEQASNRLS